MNKLEECVKKTINNIEDFKKGDGRDLYIYGKFVWYEFQFLDKSQKNAYFNRVFKYVESIQDSKLRSLIAMKLCLDFKAYGESDF